MTKEQEHQIKNIDFAQIHEMAALIDYQEKNVVSKTLSQGKNLSITLFAFDQDEEISKHSAPGDALVYVLDGQVEITIDEQEHVLETGQMIVMPANVPHALKALKRYKMLLIVVYKQS